MTAAIHLSDISYLHPGSSVRALKEVDLVVQERETVALIGPSGAGKTTLLSLLDGRLRDWTGACTIFGRGFSPEQRPRSAVRAEIGFIFQEFALIDRATVRQNVLNGRLGRTGKFASLFGFFSPADHEAAERAMRDAGVADLADRRADRLSGGQRQRVAIARCLAQDPKLILADEPVSNLDPARAESILDLITDGAARRGATVIFTSHQPGLAARFAKRIVALRNGRVVFDGPSNGFGQEQTEDLYGSDAVPSQLRLVS